jgi:hypothetical protein
MDRLMPYVTGGFAYGYFDGRLLRLDGRSLDVVRRQ